MRREREDTEYWSGLLDCCPPTPPLPTGFGNVASNILRKIGLNDLICFYSMWNPDSWMSVVYCDLLDFLKDHINTTVVQVTSKWVLIAFIWSP